MNNEVNEMITSIFRDFNQQGFNQRRFGHKYPKINAFKDGDNIEVNVYYPGVKKEEMSVNVEDGFLIIEGLFEKDEKKNEVEFIKEFSPSDFRRSFKLSKDIKLKNISAVYENGVLQIKIPIDKKKEAEKNFTIGIK